MLLSWERKGRVHVQKRDAKGMTQESIGVNLLASTPGIDIRAWGKEFLFHSASEEKQLAHKIFVLEDYLPDCSDTTLRSMTGRSGPWNIVNVLTLPLPQLVETAHAGMLRCFQEASDYAREHGQRRALVCFHPVFFHQQTSEFVSPYSVNMIKEALNFCSCHIEHFVSVHDDVFDIHRRLLGQNKLFWPAQNRVKRGKHLRSLVRDIDEQLLILGWRDRELMVSRAAAAELKCRHILAHRKMRLDSLSKVLFNDSPCVYFSHPISQPRNDINNKPRPGKSEAADPDRGRALINEIQSTANRLHNHVALFEPTCIDELRIDDGRDKISAEDSVKYIMPPITERWPIESTNRAPSYVPGGDEGGWLVAPQESFQNFCEQPLELAQLASAIGCLKSEIARQINVRDHVLAEQADAVIAFRPFVHPNSPEPTGGVREEIDAVVRAAALGGKSKHIFIVHPPDDERRRRINVLHKWWDANSSAWFNSAHNEAVNSTRDEVERVLKDLDIDVESDVARARICSVLESHAPEPVIPVDQEGSMDELPLARGQEARWQLSDVLVNGTTLLCSVVQAVSRDNPDLVHILFKNEIEAEDASFISKTLTGEQ